MDINQNDREIWRKRTIWQDLTQTWLNKFVTFASKNPQIKPENLLFLAKKEQASSLHAEV